MDEFLQHLDLKWHGRMKEQNWVINTPKYFLHISSSYAKILGETNFQPREFPRSGSKAKDVEERRRERRDRKLVITMAI